MSTALNRDVAVLAKGITKKGREVTAASQNEIVPGAWPPYRDVGNSVLIVIANNGFVTWATTFNGVSVKTASHRDTGGVPEGGNFLFEDGRGVWYKFNVKNARGTVDVGSTSGGWTLFYRPYNISTNL